MSLFTDRHPKLTAFLVIEAVLVLIALVMPVTPDKSGRPFELPPDVATYFKEVLVAFAMGNGIVIFIAILVWFYGLVRKND